MRRLSGLALLALLAALIMPIGHASAATFRTLVSQVPATPTSAEAVRVWMQSDTALGETAGLEYNIGSNYVKVLGTFDTSGPAPANWRADIPTQPNGTQVRYQLFTRNQSGQDYGFTGFNWAYTVADPSLPPGANDIQWDQVRHDTFDPAYRSIVGPTTPNKTVKLRLRVAQGDITGARVRVWNDLTNTETYYPLAWDGVFDSDLSTYDWWAAEVPTGANPTVLYYFFEINDGTDQDFYVDDDVKFYGGGFGAMSDSYDDGRGFQISVYDQGFDVPAWMQRGVVYQIFPDRFRDGNPANNPAAGRFSYGENVAIVRSNDPQGDWNTTICDPRGQQATGYNCDGRYGDNFYGGDLAGVTEKINQGYFDSLGVSVLYLNPIFRAPSNHKYDTANFLEIDPDFGTLADFQAMVAAANAHGIRIMLDGVFNHTSSDSPYFDRYGRYAETGACEATNSAYRSWFYFPATGNPGKDGDTVVTCAGGQTYEAWYGYSSLPKLQSSLPEVRDYFYGNADAVGPYWTAQGASGWRFDVGADVDAGLTNDSSNTYWEGFRTAVRDADVTGKSDVMMLGEEWGDASAWLLGNEWDSVMNYRFRSAVLSWLFTGCSGNGCSNGTKFQENDSNDNSSSGPITQLSPSQFNARLRSIQEDYPPQAFKAMMNLAGSHDTQRLRFLLKKINNNSDTEAVQRMKEWWLFAFTYAGAPTLYYGDEVGLSHDGVWDGGQYQDDPYNRAPFPWNDTPGDYTADTGSLLPFARAMSSIRHSYRALQDGDVQHGLIVDDAKQLYGFARTTGSQSALIALNRSNTSQTATFGGLNAAPYNLSNGTVLVNALNGDTYTVSNGQISLDVSSNWGVVLLEQDKIDTPAAVTNLEGQLNGTVTLTWPLVAGDTANGRELVTAYEVYRSASAGTPGTLIATVTPPNFGSGDATLSYTDSTAGGVYYSVRAANAAGNASSAATVYVAPAAQGTQLAVNTATGTYGGMTNLQATLAAGTEPVSGKTIAFMLNGATVGSATTNTSGVATLSNVSLAGIDAGSYANAIGASFAGDDAYDGSTATAALQVNKAQASLALGNLSQTFDGSPKQVSITTTPSSLSGVTVTYNGSTTAPTEAGSYTVVASLDNPNYQATNATGILVINPAPTVYSFSGFFQPVDNLPTLNRAKAGSAIPVKFSLGGSYGLNVFEAGYPKSQVVTCNSTAPIDGIEEMATAGNSGLSYDAATGQYTYVWKTEKSWANTCRQLIVKFDDGSTQRANFTFTK